jgi:hypothetical protein
MLNPFDCPVRMALHAGDRLAIPGTSQVNTMRVHTLLLRFRHLV